MPKDHLLARREFSSEKEAHEALRSFQILAGVVLAVIAGGMVFYHYVEDLSWVDSFYFCIVSLTTVGYGDISPKTEIGKLFTSFYLLVGIGIIAAFISNLVKSRLAKRALKYYDNASKK